MLACALPLRDLPVDDLADQRRLRKLGDLAREFASFTFKLLVPIRRLQTAQATGQNDLRKQAPHGYIETVVVSAWHGLPAMIGFIAHAVGAGERVRNVPIDGGPAQGMARKDLVWHRNRLRR